jgi:exopolyphosphatase/guanosine-5'-triphosphate,3'-diphosphate pyrophosphatase
MAKGSGKKAAKKTLTSPSTGFAAIDIGSNAIRMVIAKQTLSGLQLLKKYRFPIRLGADVFKEGKISAKNMKLSARTFRKFKELTRKFKVKEIRAVGTSALREAKNGKAFIELIRRKSDIRIEIIDGVEEARIIHQAVRREINLDNRHALLIDIGGGSVELTYTENGMMSSTQSFPFGTVRTLEMMKKRRLTEERLQLVIGEYLEPLMHFIHSQAPGRPLDFAVGTGGNLETLGKLKPYLLKNPNRTFLTFRELGEIIEKLQKTSLKDRIEKMKMRPDRADVILPAALVVQAILRQADLDKLLIPQVGLKDGLIWSLANKDKQ